MTPQALLERIATLPPDKRAEVEEFVEKLASRSSAGSQPRSSLVEQLRNRRERLLRTYGTYDTLPILRALRENGR
jgi:hypothetical protein